MPTTLPTESMAISYHLHALPGTNIWCISSVMLYATHKISDAVNFHFIDESEIAFCTSIPKTIYMAK